MKSPIDVAIRLRKGTLSLESRLRSGAMRVAIVGPSGVGKTTFLRALAGLEPGARGRVAIGGELWSPAPDSGASRVRPPWLRGVGWMPQSALLFPHLDVMANLRFGGATREAARDAARRVECDHLLDRRPRHLSGGEAQRVALARALLAARRLLLLDEPLAALDEDRRARVAVATGEWLDESGVPLVLVSHDAGDAARLGCDEVWRMWEGGRLERLHPTAAEGGRAP
ncbi:MAG: ATP-binding cassette domain-containing protein [Longimicrobiales bacterium]|nr:ATP-binding cassette domain-containing protein [Longimicrobiales bacterium]